MNKAKYVQHPLPTWAGQPDYVLHGAGMFVDTLVTEQLWMFQKGEDIFELACLPFYLYGLALGDWVTRQSDKSLKVVRASGHVLLRVWFEDGCPDPEQFDRQVQAVGGRTEWYSRQLVAVDVDSVDLSRLEDCLNAERLTYEIANSGTWLGQRATD